MSLRYSRRLAAILIFAGLWTTAQPASAQTALPTFTELAGTVNPLGVLDLPGIGTPSLVDLTGDGMADFVFSPAVIEPFPPFTSGDAAAERAVFPMRRPSASAGDARRGGGVNLLYFESAVGFGGGVGYVRADADPFAGLSTGDPEERAGAPVFGDGSEIVGNTFRFFVNNGDATVDAAPGGTPDAAFALGTAYPNPFAGEARFVLSTDREQSVTVTVYDALGRRVAVLHDGALAAGASHELRLDGAALAPGLYVVQARGAGGVVTKKVTKLR